MLMNWKEFKFEKVKEYILNLTNDISLGSNGFLKSVRFD
ncbi:hypothetical protein SAMN05880574_11841 [Chryseobacterium sp. RU37D]|nr:hypothetical protein SAMN05880574_11841 [Chryseobacterium sp. RU37D]